ncbi:MAG TPA: SEC-C metal-binding domain-containing protein, partial [Methylophilaceae bacterium]|nr:SEC-C metal-binding domain-containing protein [Methylophilaceae bacterium]
PLVTRAPEPAQRKVEPRNFDIRKQLLEYDDVANDQRKVIYQQRNELLEATDIADTIVAMRNDVITDFIAQHIPPGSMEEQWEVPALEKSLQAEIGLELPIQQWLEKEPDLHEETLRERVITAADEAYQSKVEQAGADVMRQFESAVMLQSLDNHWREHLAALDHLRQGIHLRSYAQKNPKQEYKREAFELFSNLLDTIKREVTQITMMVQIRSEADVEAVEKPAELENVQYQHADYDQALADEAAAGEAAKAEPFERTGLKVGRNDLCPCGSGKKYKQCHGRLT